MATATAAAAAILRGTPALALRRARFCATLSPATQRSPKAATKAKATKTNAASKLLSTVRSESDPDRIVDLLVSSTIPRLWAHRPILHISVRKLTGARRPDLVRRLLDNFAAAAATKTATDGLIARFITLYSAAGMPDEAAEAFRSASSTPGPMSFSALLYSFMKNRQPDRLKESFFSLPGKLGIAADISHYNILLRSLCQNGELDAARKVLDEMPAKGIAPDIVSFNSLLYGFLKRGDDDGFEEVLKEISKKGLEHNGNTLDCRILNHCKNGKLFKAKELLDVADAKRIHPGLVAYNAVISGLCKEGDLDSALKVFTQLRLAKRKNAGEGASPDTGVYVIMIRALVEKSEFASAAQICRDCLSRRLAPPLKVVKALVDGLMKNSMVDEAKRIVKDLKPAVKGDAAGDWKEPEGELA